MQQEISQKESQSQDQSQSQLESQSQVKEEKKEKKKAGISLKSFNKLKDKVKQEHAEESAKAEQALHIEIPLEGFLKVWNDFANAARANGKKSLHMLMTANAPVLKSKNVFEIKVATETLRETFNAEKMYLVDQVSTEFGTTHFEIEVIIEEAGEEEKNKFLATPKEKYDHMVKLNPELKNLMDELGLDFNF
jgi:hypothetical protein